MLHALDSLRRNYEGARKEWKEQSGERKRLTKRCPTDCRPSKDLQEVRRLLNKNAAEWIVSEPADNVRVLRRQFTTECTISIVYPPKKHANPSNGSNLAEAIDEGRLGHAQEVLLTGDARDEKQSLNPAYEEGRDPSRQSGQDESPSDPVAATMQAEAKLTQAGQPDVQRTQVEEEASMPPEPCSASQAVPSSNASTYHPSTAPSTTLQVLQVPVTGESFHVDSTPPTHAGLSIGTPQTLPNRTDTPSSPSTPSSLTSSTHPPNLPSKASDFVNSWIHDLGVAGDGGGGEWARLPAQRPYEADQWHAEDLAMGESVTGLEWRKGSQRGFRADEEGNREE